MQHETWRWSDDSLLNQDDLRILHIRPSDTSQEHFDLIAAAPDLLAALERAIPWLGKLIADGGHLQAVMPMDAVRTLEMAEAAIAKTKGE